MSSGTRGKTVSAHPVKGGGRYGEEGVEAARRLVSARVGVDAAAVFAMIARIRQIDPPQTRFHRTAFDALGWPPADLADRLRQASQAFCRVFGIELVNGLDLETAESTDDGRRGIEIDSQLLALLDMDPFGSVEMRAVLDAEAMTWAAIAVAAARSGSGHHLALRCTENDQRTALDFAALLTAAGARIVVFAPQERVAPAILSAELFGGDGTIVVADGCHIASKVQDSDDFEFGATADVGSLVVEPAGRVLLPCLEMARTTYVWRVPERGALPPELRRLIAASFGPVRQDSGWRAAHVKGLSPGLDAHGVRILLAQVDDARDAGAMARLAAAVGGGNVAGVASVAEACALLADAGSRGPASFAIETDFDETLLACDDAGRHLLERGQALAQGGRVLIYGPPGGGKSSFARVLAARIAEAAGGGAPLFVEPAALLARGWGATERLVAAFWAQAYQSTAVVVADEFDSMAGVRETDAAASGNALLIRTLTNEWLRQIDAYRRVPLIVTVNDLGALDPAIRRRFPIALEVRGELLEAQERRAWESILKMAPPPGWSAAGASVSDYVAAREHCRVLGRDDAESHAAALAQARALRLGHPAKASRSKRKGPLN